MELFARDLFHWTPVWPLHSSLLYCLELMKKERTSPHSSPKIKLTALNQRDLTLPKPKLEARIWALFQPPRPLPPLFWFTLPLTGLVFMHLYLPHAKPPPTNWNFNPINIKRKWKDTEIGGPLFCNHWCPSAEISLWTLSDGNLWFPEQYHLHVLEWAPQMQGNRQTSLSDISSALFRGDKIILQLPSCLPARGELKEWCSCY